MRIQRRKQKPVHEVFNDGFLFYGHKTVKRSTTGKRIGESFLQKGKLAFHLMSARDEDYRIAGAMNASLDLKLKTRFPPFFQKVTKSNLKCVIDQIEYDVIKIDWDNNKRYLYFYLQEVGVLDE